MVRRGDRAEDEDLKFSELRNRVHGEHGLRELLLRNHRFPLFPPQTMSTMSTML